MIKITEEYSDQDKNQLQKIKVTTDNKEEKAFDNYPIVIMSKDLDYIEYEAQKKQGHGKDEPEPEHEHEHEHKNVGVLERAKEKALELKDSVVDNTRQLTHDQNN